MAYLLPALVIFCLVSVACSLRTTNGIIRTTNPHVESTTTESRINVYYGIHGSRPDDVDICVFPFMLNGELVTECSYVESDRPWCSLTSDFDADQQWGYCVLIGDNSAGAANGECYIYTKMNNTLAYHGAYYDSVTVDSCKDECNQKIECRGIDFDNQHSRCFLGLTDDFDVPYATDYVDHYIRSVCPTTTVNPPSTTPSSCNDSFTVENDTLAYGGQLYSANTVELCSAVCRSFNNKTGSDYCLGFDFNYNMVNSNCYLHTNKELFEKTGSLQNIGHFTRVLCVPKGTCDDEFNKTPNTFSYGGAHNNFRTLDDCRNSCLAKKQCKAFDFTAANTTLKCFLHLGTYQPRPGNGVDQYVRYVPHCVLPTTTPIVSTTLPDLTTRPTEAPTTTPCTDTFSRTNDTLTSGGIEMMGMNTIASCKTKCLEMGDCGFFDFDTITNTCYSHSTSTNQMGRVANDVDQYIRVKCVQPTTTQKQSTQFGTTFGCQYNFTKKEDHHAFKGVHSVPNHAHYTQCQIACIDAKSKCGGYDFNNVDNTCWLISEADSDQIGIAVGIDNYRKHETCPEAPPTTPKPCEPTFEVTKDHHGFGASRVNGMNTVDKCKSACYKDSNCVAVDFNSDDLSCWMHSDANIDPLTPASGINSYRITDRCAKTSTKKPTNGPDDLTTTSTAPTTTTATIAPSGCSSNFTEVPSTHSLEGIAVNSASNVQQCKDYCLRSVSCYAVDFNSKGIPKCYWHGSNYMDKGRQADVNTTQYRLDRCVN